MLVYSSSFANDFFAIENVNEHHGFNFLSGLMFVSIKLINIKAVYLSL